VTVRKAIQELVERGLVVQRQGSGSFVKERLPRVEQSLSRLTSFSEDMARRGMTSTSTWLEKGIFVPSPDEVVALALSSGDAVSRITRLREAGGRPMAIERAALPIDVLPDPTVVTRSLYETLETTGKRPVRAIQKISAINLDEGNAALLGLPPGAAGLKIERISYLPSGRVVEFTRSIYRGDAYDFVAELRLPPA
jgi:GntR family transcriptional regulator